MSNRSKSLEFKINDLLTLKLKNDKTVIYVKGREFGHCKYLLLSISKENFEKFDEIDSIDEAIDVLNKSLGLAEKPKVEITPEEEFWGHCSNLQAWFENDYKTAILHSNLSFPLLRALSRAGDKIAMRVFKEEVAIRMASKSDTVIIYLIAENYLKALNDEELQVALDSIRNAESLGITLLDLSTMRLKTFPESIGNFQSLESLDLHTNSISNLPTSIGNLKKLRSLNLRENKLKTLPASIGNLISIRNLDLSHNQLVNLPDSFRNLKNLQHLYLKGNDLTSLPESMGSLSEIRTIDVSRNPITELPESLWKINSLEIIFANPGLVIPKCAESRIWERKDNLLDVLILKLRPI